MSLVGRKAFVTGAAAVAELRGAQVQTEAVVLDLADHEAVEPAIEAAAKTVRLRGLLGGFDDHQRPGQHARIGG